MLLFFCFLGMSGLFAGEFTVEVDQHFKTSISSDDLLAGYPFLSNLNLQAGDFLKLTDGKGSKTDGSLRTFARDDIKDWVVTFSRLKIIRLEEVRVFSWNGDQRAQQDYDLAYSTDAGKTFLPLAKEVRASQNGACNLTRVPCQVDGVTDLRFTFRNPGEKNNSKNSLHSSILEIDAIGVPLLPLTFAEARRAGRENSVLLEKSESIKESREPFQWYFSETETH
jgi:hypothetical protein